MSDNIETHPTIVKVEGFVVAETERTDDAIDVDKLHSDGGLITASQVKSDDCPTEVLELGKRAATHLEKAAKCDEKAEQHRVTAGQCFAQARAICDDGGLDAFRERFFPHVARSRAYELLAIATNKKSIETVRAETRERVARHRERTQSVTVTDNTISAASKARNGGEPTASAETRKAYYAGADAHELDRQRDDADYGDLATHHDVDVDAGVVAEPHTDTKSEIAANGTGSTIKSEVSIAELYWAELPGRQQ